MSDHQDHEVQRIQMVEQISLVRLEPSPDTGIAEYMAVVTDPDWDQDLRSERVFCVTCGEEVNAVDADTFEGYEEEE